jgi:diguanylate cyclase (GGDEF)-like protein
MNPEPALKLSVLVADDDAVTRRILQVAITRLGHECMLARDGNEALELYRNTEIDVVISDWTMPGMDGIELCKHIRAQRAATAYTYFILLTTDEDKQHFLIGMHAGADDYLRKPPDPDELMVHLHTAARITALHRQLSRQNAELERLNRELFAQGRTDALTRVGNRLRMQEDLIQLWNRARRYPNSTFCIALCDVDFFKMYNDKAGHQAGDGVLCAVARTLTTSARSGDAIYRYGGEEFLLVLPEQALAGAKTGMNRLREAIKSLAIPHPALLPNRIVTLSCGVASYTAEKSVDEIIKEADVALYVAKSRGRDQVVCYDEIPSLEAQALAMAKRG